MNHMNADQIRAYVAEKLPYDECLVCETHLATCKECAERVKVLLSVRNNFDQIWTTWTVKKHAEEFQVAQLRQALKRARAAADIRRRLTTWADNITARVDTALGISLDVSKRAARVVQEGLEFLQDPKSPAFAPAPVPLAIHGRAEAPAWIAVETQRSPWTKVTIDPVVRRILVQSEIRTGPWPLVALVAKDHDWATVASFRIPEGEEFLLAVFEDLPPGELLLLIEATPADDRRNE